MTRRAFEFWLDSLLLVLFVLALSPRMTGLRLHEWIGIAFGVPLIVHLLLSWTWISSTTRRVFRSGDSRTRVNLVLNAVLFVLIAVEIASGVVISQVAVPSLGFATINDRAWRALHNQTLNLTHLVVGLHVAMNWQWIVAALWGASPAPGSGTRPRIRLAPSFTIALGRSVLVLLAVGVVAASAFAFLGPPSLTREYRQNEIARFAPTAGHGLVQFGGEAALLGVFAYVGRRWLRVRL